LDQFNDTLRTFFDDKPDGLLIAKPDTDDFGVLDMRLNRIQRLQHRGDAALRPPGIRSLRSLFRNEQDFRTLLCRGNRRTKPGDTCTDDQYIRHLLRKASSTKGYEVTALGEGFEHWIQEAAW